MKYMCDNCGIKPALKHICYCKSCKAIFIGEMKVDGYLQWTTSRHAGDTRTGEMKENTYQTIHGTGH